MPKTTEDLYKELLAQGQQYQQQANDLLAQYDSRPAFSYNADTDPIYQSVRDQYVHQGQRAMEDTMGQAAGLTGGYGSSYSQSVGNQAYNEYLTKLNAQIPVLAQQARQAYDAEGDRLLDRYNLAMNAANTAYGQSRDALGDLRYEDELNYNRQQSELNSARDYATYLLGMGIMPSAEQLAAAGMTPQEASQIQAYYRNQMALAAGSGSGSRSSSNRTPGKTPSYTPDATPPDGGGKYTDQDFQDAYNSIKTQILRSAQGDNITYAVDAFERYSDILKEMPESMAADLMNMMDRLFPNGMSKKDRKVAGIAANAAVAGTQAARNASQAKKKKNTGGGTGSGKNWVATIM